MPAGLAIDEKTGRIAGKVEKAGEYAVTLKAKNARGAAEKTLKIIVGDRIALAPPLGWNSWNCWAGSVDEKKVRAAADAMGKSGLAAHGWTYINIDDAWQGARKPPDFALQPNEKFPDMKGLADYVHGLGLKLGIYSTPWKTSYAGYAGGSADDAEGRVAKKQQAFGKVPFHEADARQWAAWGVDYLKYDWNPIDVPHVSAMADALKASGRDIVYSLSNSAPFDHAKDWADAGELLAHHRRHHRHVGLDERASASTRTAGGRSPAPATGTTRTCSSSAAWAGDRSCTPRASPPTSSTRTSACGACSLRRSCWAATWRTSTSSRWACSPTTRCWRWTRTRWASQAGRISKDGAGRGLGQGHGRRHEGRGPLQSRQ